MLTVFVDSSVLFAMCASATGAARELAKRAVRGRVTLAISDYVFEETETHLVEKAPRALRAFRYLQKRPFWLVVEVTRREVTTAEPVTSDVFDAPIVAAAKKVRADVLVTFDRRHLLNQRVASYIGGVVVTPGQLLKTLRAMEE